jgi:hypothetical protein
VDLRKLFEPSREEETGREGKLYTKEIQDIFSHKMLFMRSDQGECHGRVCDTYWRKNETHTQFLWGSLKA